VSLVVKMAVRESFSLEVKRSFVPLIAASPKFADFDPSKPAWGIMHGFPHC